LLSSLQGVAITRGADGWRAHEFSTIPDVIEDVADIILNLKEVRFKLYVEGPKTVIVEKEGAGVVTAGDIQVDDTVEVLNPDQIICTLGKEGKYRAELRLEYGKGYVSAENLRKEDLPGGRNPDRCFLFPCSQSELHRLSCPCWPTHRL